MSEESAETQRQEPVKEEEEEGGKKTELDGEGASVKEEVTAVSEIRGGGERSEGHEAPPLPSFTREREREREGDTLLWDTSMKTELTFYGRRPDIVLMPPPPPSPGLSYYYFIY